MLDELEEVLFTADIGPRPPTSCSPAIKAKLSRQDELEDGDAIWAELRRAQRARSSRSTAPSARLDAHKPFVLLMIGRQRRRQDHHDRQARRRCQDDGQKVVLAAGDTFRAAAVEQLEVWGERAGVAGGQGQGSGRSRLGDLRRHPQGRSTRAPTLVIADTAGRLHTKADLMEELKKVGRVCDKALPGAPHETWLVLDSTTGQNAIQQAQMFKDAMEITGIVLTKLDGTAKGGVILGICDELERAGALHRRSASRWKICASSIPSLRRGAIRRSARSRGRRVTMPRSRRARGVVSTRCTARHGDVFSYASRRGVGFGCQDLWAKELVD